MNPMNNNMLSQVSKKMMKTKLTKTYAKQSRESYEEKLIVEHLPLVKHVAYRLTSHAGDQVDFEDMVAAGTVGLVKAAKSFDASREVTFKTYAYIRIRGAIIDELRSQSFVPSGVYQQIKKIEAAYNDLTSKNDSPPSDEQLSKHLGMPLQKMYHYMEEARKQNFISMHKIGNSDDEPGCEYSPMSSIASPDEQLEKKELLERLTQAILSLPTRDRQMIILYYQRELTMKEVALVLNITESRVSQLHASALFKLSVKLGARR